jgi:hypothetical protein
MKIPVQELNNKEKGGGSPEIRGVTVSREKELFHYTIEIPK